MRFEKHEIQERIAHLCRALRRAFRQRVCAAINCFDQFNADFGRFAIVINRNAHCFAANFDNNAATAAAASSGTNTACNKAEQQRTIKRACQRITRACEFACAVNYRKSFGASSKSIAFAWFFVNARCAFESCSFYGIIAACRFDTKRRDDRAAHAR